MKTELAIHGGPRAISQAILDRVPAWPPIYPQVPDLLHQVYTSRRWSFNESYEREFCQAFAEHHNAAYGVFMANGTATLECALAALGVQEGDEVIVPALTWPATAMAAVYLGAVPVFADIEPDTLCLDPQKLKAAITPKTKAVIPVHLYGSMADMEAIVDIAGRHGIAIIEDCAHGQGGIWSGRGVGSIGQIGSFSFQQSKTLSSGEGGLCITNDSDLSAKMFRLKHIGYDFSSGQGKAASSPPEGLICHNYRGTEFQAVILLESLKYLRKDMETRDANARYLAEILRDVPGVEVQRRGRLADLQSYYALGLCFDPARFNHVDIYRLAEIMGAEGLGVGGTYGPVYKNMLWNVSPSRFRKADDCTTSENVWNSTLVLSHPWLLADKETIESAAGVIRKVSEHGDQLS